MSCVPEPEPDDGAGTPGAEQRVRDLSLQVEAALPRTPLSSAARFVLNSVAGALPGVGGVLGAAAGAWSEQEQDRLNSIFATWLRLQSDEVGEIGRTLAEVLLRINLLDADVKQRVESREYMSLVRKALRDWSGAESEEKRRLLRNLLANAASTRICSDDVVRLFLDWIGQYNEAHFKVIRAVLEDEGCTRADIWTRIHGEAAREDSAEADLFKLLIRDLSVGQVIRQEREVDAGGHFLRRRPRGGRRSSSVMASAFDDDKGYVLTELGRQFIHYAMNDAVARIQPPRPDEPQGSI